MSQISKRHSNYLSSHIINKGITSINLENGINVTYDISYVSKAGQQDPEIVMGEAISAPSISLITEAESFTILAPIDTDIEESKPVQLD